MSITDELREWARDNTVQDKVLTTYPAQHPVHGTVESLLRIADRIDTEHEHGMEERADRYSELRVEMNNCYIELPKDADGKPIHVGDMLMDGLSQSFVPKKVKMMMLDNEWMLNFGDGWCAMNHHEWHHLASDTWERIIEDARAYVMNISGSHLWKNKTDELVARCKALAGGEQ